MFYKALFGLGILCIIYYFVIKIFKGKVAFSKYLLYAGIVLCIYSLIPWNYPEWLKNVIRVLFILFIIYFIYVESKIIYYGKTKVPKTYTYIIVLGAGLFGDKLSLSLKQRLDEALLYQRLGVKYICCGGQGKDELVSESSAMKKYLVENGILDNSILMEEQSTSTYENLLFASQLYDLKGQNILIVTNRFHVYRSVMIARNLGLKAYGVGAKESLLTSPLFYIREFFAYIKAKIKKALI